MDRLKAYADSHGWTIELTTDKKIVATSPRGKVERPFLLVSDIDGMIQQMKDIDEQAQDKFRFTGK